MLILRRKEGQWISLTHEASGDVIRIRVANVRARFPGQLDLVFDDDARHFLIERPERGPKPATDTGVLFAEKAADPADA